MCNGHERQILEVGVTVGIVSMQDKGVRHETRHESDRSEKKISCQTRVKFVVVVDCEV